MPRKHGGFEKIDQNVMYVITTHKDLSAPQQCAVLLRSSGPNPAPRAASPVIMCLMATPKQKDHKTPLLPSSQIYSNIFTSTQPRVTLTSVGMIAPIVCTTWIAVQCSGTSSNSQQGRNVGLETFDELPGVAERRLFSFFLIMICYSHGCKGSHK